MESLAYIVPWVLASVIAGVLVGQMLGRNRGQASDQELAEHERQATLKTLLEIFQSVERMSGEVESHTSEIQQTALDVDAMQVSGEMELVKRALLGHMRTVLHSNRRLQDDLCYSRYKMEEQAEQLDHVRREARTDALTGVANRKALGEKLVFLVAGWNREKHPFVLMMIDVDHLKRINDSHGHQAGDQVLEKLGCWLKEWLREGDFVGRYGGDEFAVLLPRTDLPAGADLAETIRSQTAQRASRITFRGEQVSLSLSIGVTASAEGDGLESLIRRADEALYRAKRAGRNQVQVRQADKDPAPDRAASDRDPGAIPDLAPPAAGGTGSLPALHP
jgi:diguanylate cyclase